MASACRFDLKLYKKLLKIKKYFEKLSKLLVEIFKHKKSSVTSILQMLDLKQSTNQCTRDFLSTVRIVGHRMLYNENEENRQKYLVKAFINGLANKKFTEALQQLKPKTFSHAYEMIKNKKQDLINDSGNCLKVNVRHDNNYLMTVINKMQKKIDSLKTIEGKL